MKFENVRHFIGEENKFKNFKDEEIDNIKALVNELKIITEYKSYNSNYISIDYIVKAFSYYRDCEGISHIDNLLKHLTKTINIKMLEEYSKKHIDSFLISFIFSYYFNYENYLDGTNYLTDIIKIVKKKNKVLIFNSYFSYYSNEGSLVEIRRKICMLYSLIKADNVSSDNKKQLKYINLFQTSDPEKIEKFFEDNKIICMMHNEIVKNLYEKKEKNYINAFECVDFKQNVSLLSSLETNPKMLESFLSFFSGTYYSIHKRDDWRICDVASILDDNKEEIIKIFRNFLKSKYSIGTKYSGLDRNLNYMKQFFNVLEYNEYSIMDIIDGLPDKIQNAALKNMLGDI